MTRSGDKSTPRSADAKGTGLYDSIETEEGEVTNETFIKGFRDASVSSVSAGTRTNIINDEVLDVRSELDSNQEFTPDKSGWYHVQASVRIFGAADGDRLSVSVREVSGSVVPSSVNELTLGASDGSISLSTTVELTAGTSYRVTVTNLDSTYSVGGNPNRNWVAIRRSVIQP